MSEDIFKPISVEFEEGQRQLILLAMGKLACERPGWHNALLLIARKLHGEEMFEEFRVMEPRRVAELLIATAPNEQVDH